jgi:DNA invertase Pin-like site-specific DNA recombinase
LVQFVSEFKDRGVGFRSLHESIDTTSGVGNFIFHLFASLAEFERDLIRERTMAGIASARARGRLGGRPKAMDAKKAAQARAMHKNKEISIREICSTLEVGRTILYRSLKPTRGQVVPGEALRHPGMK